MKKKTFIRWVDKKDLKNIKLDSLYFSFIKKSRLKDWAIFTQECLEPTKIKITIEVMK